MRVEANDIVVSSQLKGITDRCSTGIAFRPHVDPLEPRSMDPDYPARGVSTVEIFPAFPHLAEVQLRYDRYLDKYT